jgi:hypothetical protein
MTYSGYDTNFTTANKYYKSHYDDASTVSAVRALPLYPLRPLLPHAPTGNGVVADHARV